MSLRCPPVRVPAAPPGTAHPLWHRSPRTFGHLRGGGLVVRTEHLFFAFVDAIWVFLFIFCLFGFFALSDNCWVPLHPFRSRAESSNTGLSRTCHSAKSVTTEASARRSRAHLDRRVGCAGDVLRVSVFECENETLGCRRRGWLNGGPQRCQALMCDIAWHKGLCRCDYVKDPELRTCSWGSRVALMSPQGSSEEDSEGSRRQRSA